MLYLLQLQDWTLHILYAQVIDSGTYECQLTDHPPISIYSTLNVIGKFSVVYFYIKLL